MAPTLVATYQSAIGTGSSKQVTGVVAQAGDLLIVDASTYDNAGADVFGTLPTGGSGLTWTQRGSVMVSFLASRKAWSSPVGSAQTASITVNCSASGHVWAFAVEVWRDHDGIGQTVSAHNGTTGGTPSGTLSGVLASSAIHYGNADYHARTGTRTYLTATAGAFTETGYINEAEFEFNYGRHADAGAAGSKTVGQTAPTDQRWSLIALEVKGVSSVNHSASANFTGAGAMTTATRQGHGGAVTFGGAGALTATARKTSFATATFAGAGALTAPGTRTTGGSATLSGSGSLTADATRSHPGTAVFSGAGALSATPGQAGAAAFTGAGALTAATGQGHAAAASFTGVGALAIVASSDQRVTASFSGAGAMPAAGTRAHPASVALAGAGELTAAGTRVHPAPVTLAGSGSFLASGTRTAVAAAALAGAGQMIASARATVGGTLIPSVWAVDSVTGALTALPHVVKLAVSPIRNSPGQIVVEYPVYGLRHELLAANVTQDRDLEVEIWLAGKSAGALRGKLTDTVGDDLAEDAVWTFTGSLLPLLLDEVLVSPQDANPKKELVFAAANAGEIVATVLGQAQGRTGVLVGVTRDFTTAVDSTGFAWPTVVNIKFSPTATLLELLQELVDLGMIDGFDLTAGRVLRLFAPGKLGVDRTVGARPVVFRGGRNLTESPRRHSVRKSGTAVLVAGSEGVYRWAADASAEARRGRRVEVAGSASNLSDVSAVTAYAQAYLQSVTPGTLEVTHGLVFGAGHPRPGTHFDVGDFVWSDTRGTLEKLRVWQWTLVFEAGQPRGELVLNTAVVDRILALSRKLKRISSGAEVVGTSQPPNAEDTVAPAAPTGVTVDSLAYTEGIDTYATVIVGWAQVTTNETGPGTPKGQAAQLILERMQSGLPIFEDWTWAGAPQVVGVWNDELLADYDASGSTDAQAWLAGFVADDTVTGAAADDVAGYRVQWRPQSESSTSWRLGAEVSGGSSTSTSFGGVGAGIQILVRVAAYDTNGNQSAWSGEVALLTETDTTAPPVPSVPVVTAYLGQLKIAWDGLGSAGESMPADLAHVEVHLSQTNNFTPTTATLIDTFSTVRGERIATDLPYGVTHYVRLIAVDRTTPTPNRSGPSGVGSAVPEKVVGDDVLDGAVGSLKLADLAVVEAKIGLLAVNDAQFGSGSFGKLTAGTISVAVTNAGIIRTGTTGRRTEQDLAGFRAYSAADVLTVELNGDSNLISGMIRSALTGTRWEMNTDGTLRHYASGYAGYSQVASLNGDLIMRGRLDVNNRSGRINANSVGVGINFSSDAEVPNNLRAEMIVTDRKARVTSPLIELQLNGKLSPTVGNRRVEFHSTDSAGVVQAVSQLFYAPRDLDGLPTLASNNSGFTFSTGAVAVVTGSTTTAGPITATAFTVVSTGDVKDDVADARANLDPLQVIRAARSKRWTYTWEKWRTPRPTPEDPNPQPVPATPRVRFGPIAEDLPPALLTPVPHPTGEPGTVNGVSHGDTIGVLWGAVGQILDQRNIHTFADVPLPASMAVGVDYDVTVPWAAGPAQTVPAFVSAIPIGPGPIQARAITVQILATTRDGVTVRYRARRALSGLDPEDHYTINALYLFTPPYVPEVS